MLLAAWLFSPDHRREQKGSLDALPSSGFHDFACCSVKFHFPEKGMPSKTLDYRLYGNIRDLVQLSNSNDYSSTVPAIGKSHPKYCTVHEGF